MTTKCNYSDLLTLKPCDKGKISCDKKLEKIFLYSKNSKALVGEFFSFLQSFTTKFLPMDISFEQGKKHLLFFFLLCFFSKCFPHLFQFPEPALIVSVSFVERRCISVLKPARIRLVRIPNTNREKIDTKK